MAWFKRTTSEQLEFLAEVDEVAARQIRSDSDSTAEQVAAAATFEGRARSRRQAAKRKREAGQ